VGAVLGIALILRRRAGRETQIAFGPFLAIAGWLALVIGNDIVDRYLTLFQAR
jgi:leader peptidase (prepilin peptidase)/N-methyltransferase